MQTLQQKKQESEDIVVLRATEKEIEETFPETGVNEIIKQTKEQ